MSRRPIPLMLFLAVVASFAPMVAYASDTVIGHDVTPLRTQEYSLTDDKGDPLELKLGEMVSNPGESGHYWFKFKTSSQRSSYKIEIRGTGADIDLYDSRYILEYSKDTLFIKDGNYNNSAKYSSNGAVNTLRVLLEPDSTYIFNIILVGQDPYTVTVTENPSIPSFAPIGEDADNPYTLKLNKTVKSQFDFFDVTGSSYRHHYYTFKTTGKKRAYYKFNLVSLYGEKPGVSLSDGRISSSGKSTSNSLTFYGWLDPNKTYKIQLVSDIVGDTGYPSYQLTVTKPVPPKTKITSLKGGKGKFVVKAKKKKNVDGYYFHYHIPGYKGWWPASSKKPVCTIKCSSNKKIKVKAACYYYVSSGHKNVGAYSKAKTVYVR